MANISAPLDSSLFEYVAQSVRIGAYASKAELIRVAVTKLREEDAMRTLSASMLDSREGRVYRGDLKALVEKSEI